MINLAVCALLLCLVVSNVAVTITTEVITLNPDESKTISVDVPANASILHEIVLTSINAPDSCRYIISTLLLSVSGAETILTKKLALGFDGSESQVMSGWNLPEPTLNLHFSNASCVYNVYTALTFMHIDHFSEVSVNTSTVSLDGPSAKAYFDGSIANDNPFMSSMSVTLANDCSEFGGVQGKVDLSKPSWSNTHESAVFNLTEPGDFITYSVDRMYTAEPRFGQLRKFVGLLSTSNTSLCPARLFVSMELFGVLALETAEPVTAPPTPAPLEDESTAFAQWKIIVLSISGAVALLSIATLSFVLYKKYAKRDEYSEIN